MLTFPRPSRQNDLWCLEHHNDHFWREDEVDLVDVLLGDLLVFFGI